MIGRWDGHVVSGKRISLVHVSLELFAFTRVFLDVEVVMVRTRKNRCNLSFLPTEHRHGTVWILEINELCHQQN